MGSRGKPPYSVDVKINRKRLIDAGQKQFEYFNEQLLPKSFERQFNAAKWTWNNNATARKSGEIVRSPRNIVDMGTLRDSYVRRKVNQHRYDHRWEADYSEAVRQGTPRMPGRDWVSEGLKGLAR